MKLWKKKSSPPPPLPSFTSIPDEIVVDIFARLPRSQYLKLSLVSKSFRSILSSPELYAARSLLGNTEKCLYVCLWDRKSGRSPKWFTLWINPNQDDVIIKKKKKKKKKAGALLVSIPSSNLRYVPEPIVVGCEIYVIGGYRVSLSDQPSSTVRVLNCLSNTWRNAPSMNVAREEARSCVYDGKIYVMGGGNEDGPWGEVFDTKTQTWECLLDPCSAIRNLPYYRLVESDGKIYVEVENPMYAYDIKQGKWGHDDGLIATTFPCSGCVIDNVSYSHGSHRSFFGCSWYDVKDGKWKEVKGIDSLGKKYKSSGGSLYCSPIRLISFGGKILSIWEEYKEKRSLCLWPHTNHYYKKTNIWCAEISLEKRQGDEVWGNVEWVDVVHTVPPTCNLLRCVAVSV